MTRFFLKVKSIEQGETKTTNRKYVKVTFCGIKLENNIETEIDVKAERCIWGPRRIVSYTTRTNDYGEEEFEETVKISKGDKLFDTITVNDYWEAQIHSFQAVPKENIQDKTREFLIVYIAGDKSPIQAAANELYYKGFYPIDTSGKPFILDNA